MYLHFLLLHDENCSSFLNATHSPMVWVEFLDFIIVLSSSEGRCSVSVVLAYRCYMLHAFI